MMTPSSSRPGNSGEVVRRLAFFKGLQSLTTRIHAAADLDEIVRELGVDLCALFEAMRVTLFSVDTGGNSLVAEVQGPGNSKRVLRLPVADDSFAGFAAHHRRLINVRNAHDPAEVARALGDTADIRVDEESSEGLRFHQVLAVPVIQAETDALLGVLEVVNSIGGQPFTMIAEEGAMALAQTLAVVFARGTRSPSVPHSRYDALVIDGKVTSRELDDATRLAREQHKSTEQVLVEHFGLPLAELGAAAARFYNMPYEPFRADRVRPLHLLRNLKREYVDENHWLPLEETTEGVVIMAVDPEMVRGSRIAQNVYPKARLAFRVTTLRDFVQTVDQFFGANLENASVDDFLSGLDEEELDGGSLADDVSAAADNELVKLVNKIIVDAYRQGASDVHIEPRPGKEKTLIRFRKDGALMPYIEIPAAYRNPLVTRIKIMCDLDISERRRPQDGKIKFRKFAPLDIELRVATVPTAGGMEDVVMRLLGNSEPIPIDELGVQPATLARLKEVVAKPYGIFFVCGPTGSGKTTTLHSILSHINRPDTKIWTIEDPVEITQRGLRQVQVNRKTGLDFATMLRAFLRADPDVIMVGEMRDKETVSVGIEASLTGHLVLSTLHTNSAPESIVRLLDMGMDPFNFSDALLGVLAQRLARRLCPKCKTAHLADEAEIGAILDDFCTDLHDTPDFVADPDAARAAILADWRRRFGNEEGALTLHRPVGCADCTGGYRGRLGLHELMVGSDRIKHLVQERGRVSQLLATALAEGMRTLRQDGIEKVLAGLTDMAQVRKVCMR